MGSALCRLTADTIVCRVQSNLAIAIRSGPDGPADQDIVIQRSDSGGKLNLGPVDLNNIYCYHLGRMHFPGV